ncbi:hypothetical protein PSPO01_16106 [Paraphaeosphaeria sporulosa]
MCNRIPDMGAGVSKTQPLLSQRLESCRNAGMPELKATQEQELLYQNFKSFEITVDGMAMHGFGDREAINGRLTGISKVFSTMIELYQEITPKPD